MEKENNYLARIPLRTEEHWKSFERLADIMIVKGQDISEWLGGIFESSVSQWNYEVFGKEIVSGERLIEIANEKFGKRFHRNDLTKLRNSVWSEKAEYYSAPNGKHRVFRYDLNLCLPEMEKLAKGKRI